MISRKKLAPLVLWLALLPGTAMANPPPQAGKTISGDAFRMSDGHDVRLQGIKAPDTGTLADQSRALLTKLIGTQEPTLENTATDRYGRLTGQAYADGGKTWLQGEMLRAGMAFVYPPVGNEPKLAEMLAAEAEARKANRGIWADAEYADTPAERAGKTYGRFAFVTGKVLKAERVKSKVYLNFGEDWKTDFTVTIAAHDLRAFRNANLDPLALEGRTIRVRGWVKRDYGPMITVTAPAQIEVIAPSYDR